MNNKMRCEIDDFIYRIDNLSYLENTRESSHTSMRKRIISCMSSKSIQKKSKKIIEIHDVNQLLFFMNS